MPPVRWSLGNGSECCADGSGRCRGRQSARDLAQARSLSLKAVLRVEALEDQGAKECGSQAWSARPEKLAPHSGRCAFLEARFNRQVASRDLNRAAAAS